MAMEWFYKEYGNRKVGIMEAEGDKGDTYHIIPFGEFYLLVEQQTDKILKFSKEPQGNTPDVLTYLQREADKVEEKK